METSVGRVAVVGTGAIGSIIGAYLRRAGLNPYLADPWYQHIEAMKASGLRITTPNEQFDVAVRGLHFDEFEALQEHFDVVFLAVKSYDTNWVIRLVEHQLNPTGVVISAQNGINEETIAKVVGRQRTVGCVVHMGGAILGPGEVRRATDPRWATFTFGELNLQCTPRISEMSKLMGLVGDTRISENIWGALWAKLVVNCMLNATSAISGLSAAELWASEETLSVMIHLAGEVVSVSRAAGVAMDNLHLAGGKEDLEPGRVEAAHRGDQESWNYVVEALTSVAQARAGARSDNNPSMLQDMLKRRRTEVDHLNGYVARLGREYGVATPHNAVLPSLVKAVESGALPMQPSNIHRVREAGTGLKVTAP